MLHLQHLVHRHHIVIEVAHDPHRSCDHQHHDQDAECQSERVIRLFGTTGDVKEEDEVDADLRDREREQRRRDGRTPNDVRPRNPEAGAGQPYRQPLKVSEDLYRCGDYTAYPSLNAAMATGREVAEALLAEQ